MIEIISLLFFLLVTHTKTIPCDPPIDLNTAQLSDIASLPFITRRTAELILDIRPICSPLELTGAPNKIKGITENRLNNKWNWFEDVDCSESCCKANAVCKTLRTAPVASASSIYSWQIGDWNTCTSECGIGTQHRDVKCSDSDSQNIVDDIYCVTLDNKAITKRVCNTDPCPIFEWVAQKWSTCVADSYGICTQQRTLQCYDTANNIAYDDSECLTQNINQPDNTQACDYCKINPSISSSSSRSLLSEQNTEIGELTVTVNLLNEYNAQQCNTDMYREINDPLDKTLITRRACAMDIYVSVAGKTDDAEIDVSWFYIDATLIANIQQTDAGVWNNNYLAWRASDASSGWLTITFPNNGNIGQFVCNLYYQNNGNVINRRKVADFTLYVLFNPYARSDAVYMASSVDRSEYVENELGLIWLGSSDDNTATQWIYDQFYFPNLAISMDVLNRLSLEHRNNEVLISRQISYAVQEDICYGKWGSGSYTTGQPWSGYECQPLQKTCVEPWTWTGTTQIFDLYRDVLNYEHKVQYCQCWVYAGVSTTVGRALGIPTRPTTNFQSAHDSDFNRAIESYWIYDESSRTYSQGNGRSSDSVWNFHVWNEMYFQRNDFLISSYNIAGWQAVDATPQELSYGGNPALPDGRGAYQMGPAALSLIRENENPHQCTDAADKKARFGCFDAEFVISETNANYNFWKKSSDDGWTDPYTLWYSFKQDPWDQEYGTIGALTNTKKPGSISVGCLNQAFGDCDDDYIDLTFIYKQYEPSDPGMPTNTTNYYEVGDQRYRRRRRRQLLWNENNFTRIDLDLEGIEYEIITIPNKQRKSAMIITDNRDDIIDLYGDDYTFGMMTIKIDSFEDNVLDVYCSVSVTAYDYSGTQIFLNDDESNSDIKKELFNFRLEAGESTDECTLNLNYTDYSEWVHNRIRILDDAEIPYIFRFTGTATIYDTTVSDVEPMDTIIEERDILICSPILKLRDRIICRHKLRWFKPLLDLDYECDNMDADGVTDGFCDENNNYDGCFDGGDCCKQTCIPNDIYKCPYFNCIDNRVENEIENYNKCPKISSFVTYIDDIRESSVCDNALQSLIGNNNFECSQASETGNQCMDEILKIKDLFGDIESCYSEALNSLPNIIKPIIEAIIDCINKQQIDTMDTIDTTAIATFKSYDSSADGTVIIDENGNVFIDLDVSELDMSVCDSNSIGYAIYNKWDYGQNDKLSKYGADKCVSDMVGYMYNPFNTPTCTGKEKDKYFECSIGDLSGKFGVAQINNKNKKIIVEGNISEDKNEKESGFCNSRLTPESLYQRSIVFYCNDNKQTNLLCAPFQIEKQ